MKCLKIFVEKTERYRILGRPRCRCKDNIKIQLKYPEFDCVDWIFCPVVFAAEHPSDMIFCFFPAFLPKKGKTPIMNHCVCVPLSNLKPIYLFHRSLCEICTIFGDTVS